MKPVEYNHANERLAISAGSQWILYPFPNRPIKTQAENINEPARTVDIIDIDESSRTYMHSLTVSFDLWERMHPVYIGKTLS